MIPTGWFNNVNSLEDIEQRYQLALQVIEGLRKMPRGGEEAYAKAREQIEQRYSQLKTQLTNARNEEDRQMVLSRFNELTDPTSDYYRNINQQVRDNLTSVYNPNSLLARARATGLSGGGAATVANQQDRAIQGRINETANRASNQAFTNAGQQIQGLLGLAQSGTGQLMQNQNAQALLNLGYNQLNEQRRQFNASQPGFFEQLGGILGYAGGQVLGSGEKPWWLGGQNGN